MHPSLMLMWMDAKRENRKRDYRDERITERRERSRIFGGRR